MSEVNRFEDELPGVFTRVRMSAERVRLDAPDRQALWMALAIAYYTHGLALLPAGFLFAWSWKVGLALAWITVRN